MFVEQYKEMTGNTGTRGEGEVQYNPVYDNSLNRARLDRFEPKTYTRDEFVKRLMTICTNPKTGKTIGLRSAGNWVSGLFCSESEWALKLYGITRTMNGKKTDTITFGGKATAPAPAKAAKAPARKGKAKAKTVTQQKLPL
jgi:hypothetical protein